MLTFFWKQLDKAWSKGHDGHEVKTASRKAMKLKQHLEYVKRLD